jgi:ubiquitin-like protein Pup
VTDLRDRFALQQAKESAMAGSDSGGQDRVGKGKEEAEEVEVEATSDVHERVDKLTEEVDDLLDEIDDVLETNAEEFVKGYIQKGGE